MVEVRESFPYKGGDFVFTYSPDGSTHSSPGYHERLRIDWIQYHAREGLAVDFTVHANNRRFKPADIKAFGRPGPSGFRLDPPFKAEDLGLEEASAAEGLA